MVNFNGPSTVDMKLTMDLKDHSLLSVTWARKSLVNSMDQAVDMKLTMNLKDHNYSKDLHWAKDHGQFQWTKHQLT
jgi:hypothetical protein